MIRLILFGFILGLFSPPCVWSEELRCGTPPKESLWIHSRSGPARGILLLAHGLNLRPDRMNPLAEVFAEQGFDVLRVSLRGHRGNEEEFKAVTRDQWLKDLHDGYCEARKAADAQKVPLHFSGYSLGALLGVDLLSFHPEAQVHFDRMILFAPALSVHWTGRALKLLGILGSGFVVPSFANPSYRANLDGTPMAGYQALFDSLDPVESRELTVNIPTLIFVDPGDEMVSEPGIRRLVERNRLTRWKVFPLFKRKANSFEGNPHHLIIDEVSLGSGEWQRMLEALRIHLK